MAADKPSSKKDPACARGHVPDCDCESTDTWYGEPVEVRADYAPSCKRTKPWLVSVGGTLLRTKSGVGRRFKTREAAEAAGRKEAERGQ